MLNPALLKDRSNRVSPVSWRAISRLEAGTFTAMVPDWAAFSSPWDCAGNNPAKHAATTKLHENIRLNIFFILRSRIPSIRKNMDRPEASIREKERLPSIPNSGTLSPCDQHSSYCPASCRLFPPAGAEAPRLKRITSRRNGSPTAAERRLSWKGKANPFPNGKSGILIPA